MRSRQMLLWVYAFVLNQEVVNMTRWSEEKGRFISGFSLNNQREDLFVYHTLMHKYASANLQERGMLMLNRRIIRLQLFRVIRLQKKIASWGKAIAIVPWVLEKAQRTTDAPNTDTQKHKWVKDMEREVGFVWGDFGELHTPQTLAAAHRARLLSRCWHDGTLMKGTRRVHSPELIWTI